MTFLLFDRTHSLFLFLLSIFLALFTVDFYNIASWELNGRHLIQNSLTSERISTSSAFDEVSGA